MWARYYPKAAHNEGALGVYHAKLHEKPVHVAKPGSITYGYSSIKHPKQNVSTYLAGYLISNLNLLTALCVWNVSKR